MGGKLLNLVKNVPRRHHILWSGRKEPPMYSNRRSDLALEAKELFESSAGKTTRLAGVRAREETLFGYPLTRVDILDETGAEALGKPIGTYLTLELPNLPQGREEIHQAARAVAALLNQLPGLPKTGPVFVAGLGNRQMTPDALGPKTTEFLLITRHLVENLPEEFSGFRPVAALAPGVTGSTGVETGELLTGVLQTIHPACLIAVDALAARRQERVCRTIQISNTGIVPGSGVGNARMALDEAHLGLPVLAVGVPTVVEAGTMCLDLLEEAGICKEGLEPSRQFGQGPAWFVTPRNIDQEVDVLSKILGFGISAALHVDISVENVENLVG